MFDELENYYETEINPVKDTILGSFKMLLSENTFDKITVTSLTETAGISRPVFYRNFSDKYEVMEYMLYRELTSELETLLNHEMIYEAIKYLFSHIQKEEKIYRRLFETSGQNSFEQIMINQFTGIFNKHLVIFKTDLIPDNPMLTPTIICGYTVMGLTVTIRSFLTRLNVSKIDLDAAVEAYYFIISHSIFDLTTEDLRPKKLERSWISLE